MISPFFCPAEGGQYAGTQKMCKKLQSAPLKTTFQVDNNPKTLLFAVNCHSMIVDLNLSQK